MGVGVQNAEFLVLNLVVHVGTTKMYRVKKLTEDRSLSMRSQDLYLKLKPPDAMKVCFRLNREFFEI